MIRRLRNVLIVVVVAALLGLTWFWKAVNAPLEGIAEPVMLEVLPGAAAAKVAQQLEDIGVVDSALFFRVYARISGSAARIKAGEYVLNPGTSTVGIVDLLVAGKVKLHSFTIVEGWNWREVRDALVSSDVIRSTREFDSPAAMASVLQDEAVSSAALLHPEGRLFPDTYAVARGTTDVEVLQRAAALMRSKLAAAWASRADDLPLKTPDELLTLASIVERETSVGAERARVAGVFVRRLRKGMRLQTDPTVIYGLGEQFDGNLRRRDLRTDTPYNTYTRSGLPPTPIAMPGEASLLAAAQPAEGEALYFVASARLDGSHVFSATLEQHNAAVAEYVAAFRRARLNQP